MIRMTALNILDEIGAASSYSNKINNPGESCAEGIMFNNFIFPKNFCLRFGSDCIAAQHHFIEIFTFWIDPFFYINNL